MANGDVHTTYNRKTERWENKKVGNSRPSSSHDRADEASRRGQELAREAQSEWLKHRKDNNQIHRRNSYGGDPYPPRG
jgi:2',3'-cyclic-nucleotide 2'-phosphodiesterase (5'-nucleotidase family)